MVVVATGFGLALSRWIDLPGEAVKAALRASGSL